MRTRWLTVPVCGAAAALLSAAGCQVDRGHPSDRAEGTTEVPMTTEMAVETPWAPPSQEMYNASRLEGVPPTVEQAFRRQHRGAVAVTNVEAQPLETGAIAYRVSYIDLNGTPGVDLYHERGRLIEPGARSALDPTFWVSTR